MKTSIVVFKMLSLCAFFFLFSCEKSEPLQVSDNRRIEFENNRNDMVDLGDHDDASHTDTNNDDNLTDCPVGYWKGRLVTETLNVEFHTQINAVGPGDCGDWQILRDVEETLNDGEVKVSYFDGYNIDFNISEDLADPGLQLVGTINPDSNCALMKGIVYKDGEEFGSFSLEK